MRRFSIALAISAGCMTSANASDRLAGSEFGLEGMPERFVQFQAGGKVSGHGGCNRFFGSYRQTSNSLEIGELASTKKYCQGTMDMEREFLDALQKTATYKLDRNRGVMTLNDTDGAVLLTLRQRDWD